MRNLKKVFLVLMLLSVLLVLSGCGKDETKVTLTNTPISSVENPYYPFETYSPAPTVQTIIVYVTPEPTAIPTPTPTAVSTPVPTAQPIIIYITPEPTTIPIVISTIRPTNPPIIIYVTPVPTAVSTKRPTVTPTIKPTPTPTPFVTAVPTQNPGPDNLKKIQKELKKMSVSNEIIPEIGGTKVRDFYSAISYYEMTYINQHELYNILKDIFVDCIAHSVDITFSYEGSAENRLQNSLNSSICNNCGRLKMTYKKDNTKEMSYLMSQITDVYQANQIMLNFIQENTSANPGNSNERLTIVCSGH